MMDFILYHHERKKINHTNIINIYTINNNKIDSLCQPS